MTLSGGRRRGGFTSGVVCVALWHTWSDSCRHAPSRGESCVLDSKTSENDGCGVRTHALSDWRLKPAP